MADDLATGPQGHRLAQRLHRGLAALIVLLAVVTLWFWVHELVASGQALLTWPQYEGRVEALPAEQGWMELEIEDSVREQLPQLPQPEHATPRQGHARVLVPQPAYLWAGVFDSVGFAVEPQDPGRVRVIDPMGLGLPLILDLLFLGVLGLAWLGLQRLPWGRDQTWASGRWQDTMSLLPRPGQRARPADGLREPQEHLRGTRFWAIVMGLVTVAILASAVYDAILDAPQAGPGRAWSPHMAVPLLLVLALDLLLVHQFVSVRTRRLSFDDDGVADSSFFQTRRVPWQAVASFDKVNVQQAAQERYDRDFRAAGNRTRGRMRPRTAFYWIAKDPAGTELFRVAAELEADPAFEALQRRLHDRLRPQTPLQLFRTDDDRTTDDRVDATFGRGAQVEREHQHALQHMQRLQARHAKGMVVALLLVLSPFLFGTALSTWRALWFATWAERAVGTVVEKSEEGLPSLVVAYTPPGGRTHRIESDGTESYGPIPLGATITVLYDASRPEHARLDLFLELWLWPMIMGGLTLLVGLPFAFGLRSMLRGPG